MVATATKRKLPAIPARMTFEDCAQRASAAERRMKRAARRVVEPARARSYHGVYAAARQSRLDFDWITSCIAADEEIKRDAYKLRGRARETFRNNPIGRQYGRIMVNGVIGPKGFDHEAQVLDASGNESPWNAKIEENFESFSRSCTLDGQHLTQYQRRSFLGSRVEGESFTRKWLGPEFGRYGILIEPMDPDRLDHNYNRERTSNENEVVMGVERDLYGRRVAYHFNDREMSYAAVVRRERIPADQVLHTYDPQRVNQTRGVTDFHPVLLAMRFLEEYSEAELVAARIGASKPIIWERLENSVLGSDGGGDIDPDHPEATRRQIIEELEPGLFGFAPDGYKASTVAIDHPSTAFSEFIRAQKRTISSGLGVAYGELASDHSDASFSAQRSALESARETLRVMQNWWVTSFLLPLYEAWMFNAILQGVATRGRQGLVLDSRDYREFLAVKFEPRGFPYIDPLKDINADAVALDNTLECATDICAARGANFEEIARKRAKEIELCKKLGIPSSSAEVMAMAKQALAQAAADDANAGAADAAARASRNGHGGRINHLLGSAG